MHHSSSNSAVRSASPKLASIGEPRHSAISFVTAMDTTLPPVQNLLAPDGTPLALRRWSPFGDASRGTVLLVHGLGEHSGRYGHVARALSAAGWQVAAYDQRGHGMSGGARGSLSRPDDLLCDLAAILDVVRADNPSRAGGRHLPLLLLGHSMGGLVAAQLVARAMRPVDGLILSSPALDAGLSLFKRVQLAIGHTFLPDLAQSNQLDATQISHDPAVVRAYQNDPLVHNRVTARLARAIVDGGAEVLERASGWRVPTLLMWAGTDRLVAPSGSAAFATAAPSTQVRAHCFGDLYHEIFNELDARPVFTALERWLDERFAA